ncbi:MAG: chlorite dismutase family protein [Ardenticatenales bacterium]|nr:chlorite dismutase family protein [Ardenticatenales bacterium]
MSQEYQPLDLGEKGKNKAGEPMSLDRRLFMQLLAFGDCQNSAEVSAALEQSNLGGVLYADLNDARGIALLTFSEEPDFFIDQVRPLLNRAPFTALTPKPEYTMLGRTYSIGYERDLEHYLLTLPRKKVSNPEWPWAIWYPLRRQGTFEQLSQEEQFALLKEHGSIGRAYGAAEYGYDIRLASFGLDKNDNDFVIGLLGPALFPLSSIVQAMRKTKQTSQYMQQMGPFFVGKAIWQRDGLEAGAP